MEPSSSPSRSVPRAWIERCIGRALEPALEAEGFRRKAGTFYKALDECIQLVNVQGSRWNSGRSARFTLNLAVFQPAGRARIRGRLPRPPPPLRKCPMQVRIGLLMPGKRDRWWEIRSSAAADRVAKDVLRAWTRHGRRWLDWAAEP